jgi:hypothetical protein
MRHKTIARTGQAKADLCSIDQSTALRILHIVARYLPPERAMRSNSRISNREFASRG